MVAISLALQNILLFGGFGMLGYGYHSQKKHALIVSMVAWLMIGFFFITLVPYQLEINDVINASFLFAAFPLFAYLALHDWKSLQWGEENSALRWAKGVVFYAGFPYFLFDRIPIMSGLAIQFVAWNTVLWLRMVGFNNFSTGELDLAGNGYWVRTNYDDQITVPIEGAPINIIFACTAAQSIIVFVAAVFCTKADRNRKWRAFFITAPVIYLLNLFRNAGIILLVHLYPDSQIASMDIFEISHNWAAKILALVAMVIISFFLFDILPELHNNILEIISLGSRKPPWLRDLASATETAADPTVTPTGAEVGPLDPAAKNMVPDKTAA